MPPCTAAAEVRSHAATVTVRVRIAAAEACPASAAPPQASTSVSPALMKVTPTSGPIATSNTHHARDATSSRYSFVNSQRKEETTEGAELANNNSFSPISAFFAVPSLRERKEHLFQILRRAAACGGHRSELVERAFAADA